jgi:hypothetical protein
VRGRRVMMCFCGACLGLVLWSSTLRADNAVTVTSSAGAIVVVDGQVHQQRTVVYNQNIYERVDPIDIERVVKQHVEASTAQQLMATRSGQQKLAQQIGAQLSEMQQLLVAVEQFQRKMDGKLDAAQGAHEAQRKQIAASIETARQDSRMLLIKIRDMIRNDRLAEAKVAIETAEQDRRRLDQAIEQFQKVVALDRRRSNWTLVLGGAGFLGLGVGTYFALSAQSSLRDSRARCNQRNVCTDEGIELRDSAGTQANVATVALGFGASALLGAGVLLFAVPSASDSSTKPAARVQLTAGQAWRLSVAAEL